MKRLLKIYKPTGCSLPDEYMSFTREGEKNINDSDDDDDDSDDDDNDMIVMVMMMI